MLLRIPVVFLFLCVSAFAQGSPDPQAVQRYFEEGQKALAANQYPQAEEIYKKLRQWEPGIAEIHANLGLIYFQQRKFQEAVPALRQALKLKPALVRTDSLLAMSLSELGQYREALPGLEKGFHKSTDPAIKRMCGLQLQRAYTGLQKDREAVNVALELNRLYPNDPEILYQTGKIYGNFAFLTIYKLAQVAPESPWRHLAIAEAQESQGQNDVAINEYRLVLGRDPNWPNIHYRLGRTLLARSRQNASPEADIAAAAQELEQELRLNPNHANAAYEIAEIHRNAGRFPEAQHWFEAALEHYENFEEAQLGLASVLMSEQKPALALAHLQKAVELDQENEVAWYRLSQAYAMLGNTEERQKALAEFQRLRSQKSSKEDWKKLLSTDEVTKQQLGAEATQ